MTQNMVKQSPKNLKQRKSNFYNNIKDKCSILL